MAADGRSTSPDQGIWEARGKPQHYVVASSADRLKVPIPYDYLIVATGVRHSYFGHEEFGTGSCRRSSRRRPRKTRAGIAIS